MSKGRGSRLCIETCLRLLMSLHLLLSMNLLARLLQDLLLLGVPHDSVITRDTNGGATLLRRRLRWYARCRDITVATAVGLHRRHLVRCAVLWPPHRLLMLLRWRRRLAIAMVWWWWASHLW